MKDQGDNVTLDMFDTKHYYLVALNMGVDGYIKIINHAVRANDSNEAIEMALNGECHNDDAYVEGVQPVIDDIFEYSVQSCDEITYNEYSIFRKYNI